MNPAMLVFEVRDSEDKSWIKMRVEYDSTADDNSGRIVVKSSTSDDIWIDPENIEWLIEALQEVRTVIRKRETQGKATSDH